MRTSGRLHRHFTEHAPAWFAYVHMNVYVCTYVAVLSFSVHPRRSYRSTISLHIHTYVHVRCMQSSYLSALNIGNRSNTRHTMHIHKCVLYKMYICMFMYVYGNMGNSNYKCENDWFSSLTKIGNYETG